MTAVHGFVDESARTGVYRLTIVRVATVELDAISRAVRTAIIPGQFRIHLVNERPPRQRAILNAYGRLPIRATVYEAPFPKRTDDQIARDRCLRALVSDLTDDPIRMLVLDTRGPDRDARDRRTLVAALGPASDLQYTHRGSRDEPLISLPDAIGWAVGASAEHRQRVAPVLTVRPC